MSARHHLAHLYPGVELDVEATLKEYRQHVIDELTGKRRVWVHRPKVGRGSRVERGAIVGWHCHIGRRVHIGPFASCDALQVGDDSYIGPFSALEHGVWVGRNVMLRWHSRACADSIILDGSLLEEDAVVPMGSILCPGARIEAGPRITVATIFRANGSRETLNTPENFAQVDPAEMWSPREQRMPGIILAAQMNKAK